jgi:hypothetical protein
MQPGAKKYWFPAKKYGWGWGPPACWQGWAVLGIWLLVFVASALCLASNIPAFVVFALLLATILTFICYLKGEPPRWRWGKR